jgi:diadenosine tetraphosphate (Ap4A) HIT family hydrolase
MNTYYNENCLTCQSVQGIINLSKYQRIHESEYWVVEHMSPCAIKGWIVVALKRHCTGLHELKADEFMNFAQIARNICLTMKYLQNSEKEYVMQFAEKDRFGHVHFHVISRLSDWPQELKGINIFNAINSSVCSPIMDDELEKYVIEFKKHFNSIL